MLVCLFLAGLLPVFNQYALKEVKDVSCINHQLVQFRVDIDTIFFSINGQWGWKVREVRRNWEELEVVIDLLQYSTSSLPFHISHPVFVHQRNCCVLPHLGPARNISSISEIFKQSVSSALNEKFLPRNFAKYKDMLQVNSKPVWSLVSYCHGFTKFHRTDGVRVNKWI